MSDNDNSSFEIYAYLSLLLSVFTSVFSLPVGRTFLGLSLLLIIVDVVVTRKRVVVPRTAWIGLVFLIFLVFVTATSEGFRWSESKLIKLIWFAGLPIVAILVKSTWRLMGLLGGYVLGAAVLAVNTFFDSIVVCAHGASLVKAGTTTCTELLINAGSMTDGQRLMLGVIIAVGLIYIAGKAGRPTLPWWIFTFLLAAALVLTFKRGSLICACGLVFVFVALRTNWKYILLLMAVVLALSAMPPVKTRLVQTRDEFREGKGGRMTMWVKIAPVLVRQHPWVGIGYRRLTNEIMVKIAPEVEKNRDHLHSNIVQMVVDGGLIGFVLYIAWMLSACVDAVLFVLRSRNQGVTMAVGSLVVALMLAGLLVHGLVEYNFGDAEIVLIYGLVMGCAAAGRTISSERNSAQSVCPGP